MAFTHVLPDPNNPITHAGASTGTLPVNGPGYASVSLKSVLPSMTTRTNSGRAIVRNIAGHKWEISISYNPLTRAEFEPMHAFLLQKKGATSAFFVSLPQYIAPQNATFATYLATSALKPTADVPAGKDTFMLDTKSGTTFAIGTHKAPSPGDIFTITDTNDTNHVKVYMITRVEHNDDYSTTPRPTINELKISFTPPLQRSVQSSTTTVDFTDVKFRVINKQKDIGYNLDVNNLYKLSLSLEEAQP